MLLRNTAHYDNIRCVRAAVWHTAGVVEIKNPDAESWAFEVGECESVRSNRLLRIPAMTITMLGRELGVEYLDLLKLDIEGAEQYLFLPEHCNWVRSVRTIAVEPHKGAARDIVNRITRACSGRKITWHSEYMVLSREHN